MKKIKSLVSDQAMVRNLLFRPLLNSKTLLVLACVFLFISSSYSGITQQKISIELKDVPLKTALSSIEQKSSYRFVYNDDMLPATKRVNISATNESLEAVMKQLLQNTMLSYRLLDDNTVVLYSVTPAPIVITGRVVDETDKPLENATVMVKGSAIGTKTNEKGEFRLNLPDGDNVVLVVSYVGYESREIKASNNMIVVLKPMTGNELEKVVVTALGIRRKEKAITYNVQEISGQEVNTVKDVSFVNSLAGKVAGVNINSTSTGIGGSTRVVMRGTKSIYGNNNALYVVDGIPLPNLFSTQATAMYESKDNGDGISLINPDDIANITVLTGPSAAALYGSQAANGVILITTNKGLVGKPRVNFSNNTNFFSPLMLPEFQNTYGSDPESFSSWGAKLKTPSSYDPEDFFQTGSNVMNAVNMSTGSDKNQTYISGSATNAKGIVPHNKYNRYNFSVRNTSSIIENKVDMDLNFMYVKQDDQNMIGQGRYYNPLLPVYLFPRGDDIEKYKVYERYDVTRNFKTQFWPFGNLGLNMQNPYWIINRNLATNNKDRYIVGAALKYNVFDWLNVVGRLRMDNTYNTFERKLYASTDGNFAGENGYYANYNWRMRQNYADILVSINKTFDNKWGLTANAGASYTDSRYEETGAGGDLLAVANMFHYNNIDKTSNHFSIPQNIWHDQVQAIYGTAQLSYRNRLFLDVTGRNDWTSPLAGTSTKSIFYPSIGLSGIISDMLTMPRDIISYIKVRASYSEVGNSPTRYVAQATYPFQGGYPATSTFKAVNLKPERTKSWEAGVNLKFLKNRVNFDVTYYNANTFNQLFNITAAPNSGYKTFYMNAGKVNNWGIEAALGYKGKIVSDLEWSSNVTFTMNRNTIKDLVTNMEDPLSKSLITIDTFNMGGTGTYYMKVAKGGSMGDLYTSTLLMDHHNYVKVDPQTGGVSPDPNNIIKVGNANPDFNIGFRNSFSYKNFTLGFLIDGRFGGECISSTQALMDQYGVSKTTAEARDAGGALVNGYRVNAQNYYTVVGGGETGILSEYVYSATNVRLREASFGYTFPSSLFNNKIQAITVSVIGRNLFMFYNKAPYDPELTASSGTYYQGFDYFMQPSLRSIGFSVRFQF